MLSLVLSALLRLIFDHVTSVGMWEDRENSCFSKGCCSKFNLIPYFRQQSHIDVAECGSKERFSELDVIHTEQVVKVATKKKQ